jgi:hypothetical protein
MKLARYNVHCTTHTPLSLPPPIPRHTFSSRLSVLRENITVCIKRPRCDMEIGYRFRAGCTVRKIRVHTTRGVRFTVDGILPTCPTECGHDWLLTIYRFVILTSLELLPCFVLRTHLHSANSKVLRMYSVSERSSIPNLNLVAPRTSIGISVLPDLFSKLFASRVRMHIDSIALFQNAGEQGHWFAGVFPRFFRHLENSLLVPSSGVLKQILIGDPSRPGSTRTGH